VPEIISPSDPYTLSRFTRAQETKYGRVLAEVKDGRKETHWMWYIFPQIKGLGRSSKSEFYAIEHIEEALEYLRHPVLGVRLFECTEAVLAITGRSAHDVFGSPDDSKLRSCMTLFEFVSEPGSIFVSVLGKYFNGCGDDRTLNLLKQGTS